MCDDLTPEDLGTQQRAGLNRREFAVLGASAALAGCTSSIAAEGGSAVTEKMVSITTKDGVCDAFFVHPGKGAHPGIVMWPDIAGLRDVKKIMARSLAAQGYAVLVVNQYYRSGPSPIMRSFSEYRTPEGQAKIGPMRAALTPDAITRDAAAYVGFLDRQDAVDKKRKIGSNGYCMGGPFTVRTAAAVPARVGAAASLHGAGLTTEDADSPHKLLAKTSAGYLFAIARNDDAKQPDQKAKLREAAEAAGRPADIEVYAADHGWCVPDSPAYDPTEADRAWQQMLTLFAKL
jgi:carboxymethylenebutenolidase